MQKRQQTKLSIAIRTNNFPLSCIQLLPNAPAPPKPAAANPPTESVTPVLTESVLRTLDTLSIRYTGREALKPRSAATSVLAVKSDATAEVLLTIIKRKKNGGGHDAFC
jgi:hypothetical protein